MRTRPAEPVITDQATLEVFAHLKSELGRALAQRDFWLGMALLGWGFFFFGYFFGWNH